MATMLIDNHKQTIMTLLQDGEALLQQIGDQENTKKLQAVRQEVNDKKAPAIMFYGLYNAGKSTLINALCKSETEIAPTGDYPKTTSIQTVPWEGYTLIDTPGINAHKEHTEIAEKEIRQRDVILFIVDNSDSFDNAIVSQAIVKILKMGKPLAVVVNQKNVAENEDPNIPVPDQPSIWEIVKKISQNIENEGSKNGMQIVGETNNFLGIFPLNAFTAFKASAQPKEIGDILYNASGILSLRNMLNESIRRSQYVYMLRTPLINLRDVLRDAMTSYQSASIYGEKQQLAENRESLITSRQRLRDRLMADGYRKIEAALEEVKAAAAKGQAVEDVGQTLTDSLNALLKEAIGTEQEFLQEKIQTGAITAVPTDGSSAEADSGERDSILGADDFALLVPLALLGTEITIPIALIKKVVDIIDYFISKKKRAEKAAAEAARQNQEQLANYYKWLNDLRDQEIKIKATYEKTVNDFLQQNYAPKLEQIDRALAEVDGNCAEHTRNLRAMEQLLMRVGDEMIALPEVM